MNNTANDYFSSLYSGLSELDENAIQKIIEVLFNAWRNNRQIFVVGNGGSASTASHMACDIGKGTLAKHYDTEVKRFRIQSLTDNVATMSAYSNDIDYNEIFKQQLNNLIEKGDVLICISASGNSENVVRAARYANNAGATTIGLLGFEGGKLNDICDFPLVFREKHYGRVEDAHLILNHYITERLSELTRNYEQE